MISKMILNGLMGHKMMFEEKIREHREELRRIKILEQAAKCRLQALLDRYDCIKFVCSPDVILTKVSNKNQGNIILGRIKVPLAYRLKQSERQPRYWSFVVGKINELPPIGSDDLRQIAEDKAHNLVLSRVSLGSI